MQWIKDGFMTATVGDVIDYEIIRRDINALGKKFDIKEIAADRWNATQLITQLEGDGFNIFAFGQGYRDMSAPTKELEKLIIGGMLRTNKNPVMRWMAGNVYIERDAAENIKPSKKKSTERIDGIVAAVMAIGRATSSPVQTESIYNSPEKELMFL
jgi:phage terminase large subunit-like protein